MLLVPYCRIEVFRILLGYSLKILSFAFCEPSICVGDTVTRKTIGFHKFCYNIVAKNCTWFFFFGWMNLKSLHLSLRKLSDMRKPITTTLTAKQSAVVLFLSIFGITSQINPYVYNQPLKVRISTSMTSDEVL